MPHVAGVCRLRKVGQQAVAFTARRTTGLAVETEPGPDPRMLAGWWSCTHYKWNVMPESTSTRSGRAEPANAIPNTAGRPSATSSRR